MKERDNYDCSKQLAICVSRLKEVLRTLKEDVKPARPTDQVRAESVNANT